MEGRNSLSNLFSKNMISSKVTESNNNNKNLGIPKSKSITDIVDENINTRSDIITDKCSNPECKETEITGGCGCGTVKYCSENCHRKHWSLHKLECINANKPIKNHPKTQNELYRLQQIKERALSCLQAHNYLNHSTYLSQTSLTDKSQVSKEEFKINQEKLMQQNQDLYQKTLEEFNALKLDDNNSTNNNKNSGNLVLDDLNTTLSKLFSEYDENISRFNLYKGKGVVVMIIGYLEDHSEDDRGAIVDIETNFMMTDEIEQRLKLLAKDIEREETFFNNAVERCFKELNECKTHLVVLRINILDISAIQTHVYRHKVYIDKK
jgi:hypothetical protein